MYRELSILVSIVCWAFPRYGVANDETGDEALCAGTTEAPECEPKPGPATEHVPDFNTIKTPESPAFSALGLSPSQIQRPTTPTGFALSVAGGFHETGILGLTDNFAVEAAPYWLVSHPNLTVSDVDHQRGRAWYRNLSISIAAVSAEQEILRAGATEAETARVSSFAAGLRTSIIPGRQSAAARKCQRYIRDFADLRAASLRRARTAFQSEWERTHPEPERQEFAETRPEPRVDENGNITEEAALDFAEADAKWLRAKSNFDAAMNASHAQWNEERNRALAEFGDRFNRENQTTPALTQCLATIQDREGFVWDVAGAFIARGPGGDVSRHDEVVDGGTVATGWSTLGVLLRNWSLLLSGRVHPTWTFNRSSWLFDGGARAVFALKRVGFALEGVYRYFESNEDRHLYRIAGGFDYRLRGGMWLSITVGKDFGRSNDEIPILALANIQWNFGMGRAFHPDRRAAPEVK